MDFPVGSLVFPVGFRVFLLVPCKTKGERGTLKKKQPQMGSSVF